MNVIVVDNLDWKNEGADLGGNPPFDIVNVSGKTFAATIEYLAGSKGFDDVVYLINVHCVFASGDTKTKYNFQQQNGVAIYRHLLKIYEDNQEKLKVAFFSPITVENLVKLKSENAVLEHHPFFHVPFKWNNCVTALQAKTDWKYFNNASENLLSGYSIYASKNPDSAKIKTKDKKILFVDDQAPEWKTVFNEMVTKKEDFSFYHYQRDSSYTKGFDASKIQGNNFKNEAQNADLIISDFYLQENHEIDKWKSAEELEYVSGFQLFKYIKNKLNAGIPMVIHTSSNKVRYFQFLDSNGLDGWITKDVRVNATAEEKELIFESLKRTIEKFTVGENAKIYKDLKEIWKKIQTIRKSSQNNWWYVHADTPQMPENDFKKLNKTTKNDLLEILVDAYFAIRNYLKRESFLAKDLQSKDLSFSASSIASNLGYIYELLFGISQSGGNLNLHLRFFFAIRNAASHYAGYKYFNMEDAILYFHYWLLALEDNTTDVQTKFAKNGIEYIFQPKDSIFRLLYIWIQFFNSETKPNEVLLAERVKNRMYALLSSINHQYLFNELGKTVSDSSLQKEYNNLKGQICLDSKLGSGTKFSLEKEGKTTKLKLSNP
jgi:hypothetical protein